MEKTTTQLSTPWEKYRAEFPICQRKTYFNTCSLGALSTRVASAVRQFTELWDVSGAAAWYGPWLAEIERLRERFAALIGAWPDEIAIFPSVTTALTAVASAFDYRARPRVVISDLEFPTTVYQWLVKEPGGVTLEMIHSPDRLTIPVDEYARAADAHTQLLVASHVYFTSGVIQDIAAVARVAHQHGAHCLIDAYQSIGQLPADVHVAGVDFLITGGLKWLLGGPGVAYLYVRRDLAAQLRPTDVGWFAHRDQFAFDIQRFTYADGARRFEGGTPSVAAVYAGRAGIDIVAELGVSRIRAHQIELVSAVVDEARRLRPAHTEELAGIVTIPREDPKAVVAALSQRGIIVDARPGLVRLSPYFYNTPEECAGVVAAIAELEKQGIT
ncbi:MAG: aminotransferase class V-fold PLP-dependent enzyme [Bacillati bacterium ANGP1]|uniref:Aminotransferase class V-fold PLP-dependent enzyme n=1 Tax=Candidatus Segetimicrobium genomatis TaxID=2569760 RepID=A0A537L2J6_9BACT|nr:MAG: aminotransferase class V-fold PLP-dependent enzyme [Terrabacteria group bacterium ANGP1]